MDKTPGTLYLLPSTMSEAPVADVLPQANLDIMRRLRHFIVENVRTARRFLRRCDPAAPIDAMTFSVIDTHTPAEAMPAMLAPLFEGHDMGVISEAGCPAVADPGADIVDIAQRKGVKVVPLVGPSSILMALMGSGFNGQRFTFQGYLPIDDAARAARLQEMTRRIERESTTQIFIETPYRNNRLIAELTKRLPGRMRLCAASDITGPRQSIVTLSLSDWSKRTFDYNKIPTIFLLYK